MNVVVSLQVYLCTPRFATSLATTFATTVAALDSAVLTAKTMNLYSVHGCVAPLVEMQADPATLAFVSFEYSGFNLKLIVDPKLEDVGQHSLTFTFTG